MKIELTNNSGSEAPVTNSLNEGPKTENNYEIST